MRRHVSSWPKIPTKNWGTWRFGSSPSLSELFDEFKTSIGRELNPRAEIDWVNGFYDYICKKLNMDDLRASITHDLEVLELKYELMDTRYNSIRSNS